MNWKEFLSDYLNFSRKERIAAIVIVMLIFFIWFSPQIFHLFNRHQASKDSSWIAAFQTFRSKKTSDKDTTDEYKDEVKRFAPKKSKEKRSITLFEFDPNQATAEEWGRLGLHDKTIQTIKNFLAHGGHFKKPEDLLKIYGLAEEDYARLEPYIKINNANQTLAVQKNEFVKTSLEKKVSKISIDINSADTTEFISLPGIGNKLASRIVNFREKLGGFYSIEQVGETYALSDSTFQTIKPLLKIDNIEPRKINVNIATKDELKIHPYLRWNLANAIVEYRNQHGSFTSVDDLKKISLITDSVFQKINHYLTVN